MRRFRPIGGADRIRHLGDGRRLAAISEALDVWDLSTRTIIHHLTDPGAGTFMDNVTTWAPNIASGAEPASATNGR